MGDIESKAFAIFWAERGSEIRLKPVFNDGKALRLVCRSWRDIIDKTLPKLKLSGDFEHMSQVSERWERWPAIEELLFYHSGSSLHLSSFASCKWERLEKLGLRSTYMHEDTAEAFAAAVRKSWTKLRVLEFGKTYLKPPAMLKLAAVPWNSLEEVVFGFNAAMFHTVEDVLK